MLTNLSLLVLLGMASGACVYFLVMEFRYRRRLQPAEIRVIFREHLQKDWPELMPVCHADPPYISEPVMLSLGMYQIAEYYWRGCAVLDPQWKKERRLLALVALSYASLAQVKDFIVQRLQDVLDAIKDLPEERKLQLPHIVTIASIITSRSR